jgi:ADP-ribose pyrophosphatase YjhB (NUDIX family)
VRSTDAEARRGREHYQAIVDVHLLLMREGRVLLGRRANTGYGDGAYEPPSSRLAERETIVEAAIRVAAAQPGIALGPSHVSLAHVMHDVSGAGRIAFFLTADGWDGEPGGGTDCRGTDGHGTDRHSAASYSDFDWFDINDLPANMIDRARVAVRNYAAGVGFSTYPAFGC